MKAFSALIERLAFEPRRNGKIVLMAEYFRTAPDPDRGYALAALTSTLDIPGAKPALLKALIAERTDETLFRLSYDFVGDLSETIALMWPATPHGQEETSGPEETSDREETSNPEETSLGALVEALLAANRRAMAGLIPYWLDRLDETGRWALLKLMTGGLRIGVSAALAKAALAEFGGKKLNEIEEIWHGLTPPYADLFAWLEGRSPRPEVAHALTFRSPMLAHPIEEAEFATLAAAEFLAEWKWDGIRVQAAATRMADGIRKARLFSRSGDDISGTFPDLVGALDFDGVIDGELVIRHGEAVATFSDLQQRLNRKQVTAKMLHDLPAHLIAYDLLFEGQEDLRPQPFEARRHRLQTFLNGRANPRISLSPLVPFASWEELAIARQESAAHPAIEGVMLKRAGSPYLAGRPKGLWYKWKRAPGLVDCVMMYAQRGHGKRSSYYSDFTFGVWDEDRLVPVGKAYFGFTDAELVELDRFVRRNTINRFGPVREVVHTAEEGLVLEIAYEGLQESGRHKSGIAMRFPRIHRIRFDKKPAEADRLTSLKAAMAPPREPDPA